MSFVRNDGTPPTQTLEIHFGFKPNNPLSPDYGFNKQSWSTSLDQYQSIQHSKWNFETKLNGEGEATWNLHWDRLTVHASTWRWTKKKNSNNECVPNGECALCRRVMPEIFSTIRPTSHSQPIEGQIMIMFVLSISIFICWLSDCC